MDPAGVSQDHRDPLSAFPARLEVRSVHAPESNPPHLAGTVLVVADDPTWDLSVTFHCWPRNAPRVFDHVLVDVRLEAE
jgi:hypothetical protein